MSEYNLLLDVADRVQMLETVAGCKPLVVTLTAPTVKDAYYLTLALREMCRPADLTTYHTPQNIQGFFHGKVDGTVFDVQADEKRADRTLGQIDPYYEH